MNNPTSPRPRFVCRAVRQWESVLGAATDHTFVTERHLEVCDECQAFFAEDVAFEQVLRRDAQDLKSEPEAGFNLRIMQAVSESLPEREPRVARVRSIGFSLTAVAAGAALALVVAQRNAVPEKNGPMAAVGDGEALAATAEWLGSTETRNSALQLVQRNPLEQEIDSISSDAQSVIGFLALNFLPSAPAESPANPEDSPTSPGRG